MSGTLILYYHSVSENADWRVDPSIVVRPATFENQLGYLAKHYHVVSLIDLIESMRSKRALPPNSMVITFDDGYRDNVTTAAPLLKQFGFPAMFFLATGYIGAGRMKWEDKLSYILHNTRLSVVSLDHADLPDGKVSLPLDGTADRMRAFNWLINRLSYLKIASREALMDQIETLSQVSVEQVAQELMLSWEDVRAMAEIPGITFGCHTVEHERLSTLGDEEVRREILESRRTVEEKAGASVGCFAYPYGLPTDYDARAVRVLRENGFDCAVTTSYTSNGSQAEPFSLGRILAANSAGLRFGIGLAVRGSPIGETMRNAITLLKRLT